MGGGGGGRCHAQAFSVNELEVELVLDRKDSTSSSAESGSTASSPAVGRWPTSASLASRPAMRSRALPLSSLRPWRQLLRLSR